MMQTCTTEIPRISARDEIGEHGAGDNPGTGINERKQLEEQLLRAQRLEAAGQIAGQVAHDLNNLLGQLAGYPELIKETLPEGHAAIAFCDAMSRAAQRIIDINADMLALSRRALLDHRPTDLNQLAEQATELLADAPPSLEIRFDLAPDAQPVSGSSAQLWRVLSNLIVNARDAMQDSGVLHVKTEGIYVDHPLGRHNIVEVGEYVRLSVTDTGCGIPAAIRERIFDPFFTTKMTGPKQGSGLGLSVVRAIVDDHKGYIDVKSDMEAGTSFSVYLPVHRQADTAVQDDALTGDAEGLRTIAIARRPASGSGGPEYIGGALARRLRDRFGSPSPCPWETWR